MKVFFFFFLSLTWGNRKGKLRLKQQERAKPRGDDWEGPRRLDGGDSVGKRCIAALTVYRGEMAAGTLPGMPRVTVVFRGKVRTDGLETRHAVLCECV